MPAVLTLYIVWAGIGVCMAATLYEPAFVIVGRAYDDPTRRLRALAVERVEARRAQMTRLAARNRELTLARRDFPHLVSMLRRIEGIRDLSVTTNGYLLERDAAGRLLRLLAVEV